MFQSITGTSGELMQILEQELDSFNSVLQFSEKFVAQVDSLPMNNLTQMVNYRQEWIDKIQRLEERRKKFASEEKNDEISTFMRQISATARKLVDIDKDIYNALQARKIKFIKEHATMIEKSKMGKSNSISSQKVDIRQE